VSTVGGSAGTAGSGFREAAPINPSPNARRLAWFSDDELLDEVRRRRLTSVLHNHTRFRNNGGPWSPCPASCPAGPMPPDRMPLAARRGTAETGDDDE
jgi:hypothetical protein